ncbi:unnamed protein product [Ectocarpus fasciculatus]
MLASTSGHRSTVEALLRAGADTTPYSSNCGKFRRMTALDMAAARGHFGVVQVLVGNGGDARAHNHGGYTALHYAAFHEHGGEVVDVLLDAGADINAKTLDEMTPLLLSAMYHNDETMVALLKRGGNVNETSDIGDKLSVLHWACFPNPGVDRTLDLLMRWGASETTLDTNGRTPSDLLEEEVAEIVAGSAGTGRNSVREGMQREVQRGLALLARAPADRTWRRRCWLVMLRARAGREREARSSSSSSGRDRTDAAGQHLQGHDEDDGSNEVGKMDAGGSGSGPINGDRGGAGRAKRRKVAEEGSLSLRGLVPALLGLESEGVFRTIVCFL